MKKLNAYMTIEASFIIPLVIGTYMFLIFASLYLYNKCVINQDSYIKTYRASTFTYWTDEYGEVAYGVLAGRSGSKGREYIESVSDYGRYPFFSLQDEKITSLQVGSAIPEIYVSLNVKGSADSFLAEKYALNINKISLITNPVTHIRKTRRVEKREEREERREDENAGD